MQEKLAKCHQLVLIIHCVPLQKNKTLNFCHNFGKCTPISEVLLLSDSQENSVVHTYDICTSPQRRRFKIQNNRRTFAFSIEINQTAK